MREAFKKKVKNPWSCVIHSLLIRNERKRVIKRVRQIEGAVALNVRHSSTSRVTASAVHHRHLPQQALPVDVNRLSTKIDLAKVESISRLKASMERQNQVFKILCSLRSVKLLLNPS